MVLVLKKCKVIEKHIDDTVKWKIDPPCTNPLFPAAQKYSFRFFIEHIQMFHIFIFFSLIFCNSAWILAFFHVNSYRHSSFSYICIYTYTCARVFIYKFNYIYPYPYKIMNVKIERGHSKGKAIIKKKCSHTAPYLILVINCCLD